MANGNGGWKASIKRNADWIGAIRSIFISVPVIVGVAILGLISFALLSEDVDYPRKLEPGRRHPPLPDTNLIDVTVSHSGQTGKVVNHGGGNRTG